MVTATNPGTITAGASVTASNVVTDASGVCKRVRPRLLPVVRRCLLEWGAPLFIQIVTGNTSSIPTIADAWFVAVCTGVYFKEERDRLPLDARRHDCFQCLLGRILLWWRYASAANPEVIRDAAHRSELRYQGLRQHLLQLEVHRSREDDMTVLYLHLDTRW